MGQLVANHALELGRREEPNSPVVAQTVALRGEAADRERVRHCRLRDRDPRLGEVRMDAQPLDQAMQLRRLLWTHLMRDHRASAIFSEVKNWNRKSTRRDHRDRDRAGPAANSTTIRTA
jgi:hypothetical protein